MNTLAAKQSDLDQRESEAPGYASIITPAILSTQGNTITLDTDHPSFAAAREHRMAALGHAAKGPGTELKKLLGKIGIASSANCSCNQHAQTMNKNGPQWCRDNIETIVDWLETEARKRGLPFVRFAGRRLVMRAIRNAGKR